MAEIADWIIDAKPAEATKTIGMIIILHKNKKMITNKDIKEGMNAAFRCPCSGCREARPVLRQGSFCALS